MARSKTATRDRIAASARRLFAEGGYTDTSVRAIAADAGIDPALVIRYFGSKDLLFMQTLDVDNILRGMVENEPLDGLGVRIVRKLLADEFADGRAVYMTMVRATDNDAIRQKLRSAIIANLIVPLTPRLKGRRAELRTRLIATHIGGLLHAISIFPDDPLLHRDREALIEIYGRGIQHLIDNT